MIVTANDAYVTAWLRLQARAASVPAYAWLLIIAVPLRFINLGVESFWYDETFTAWITGLPFGRMMTAIQGDVHPPLFYWIEWVVSHTLGGSEYALRLPSAIFGTIAVLLLWRVALAIGFDKRAALAAGIIAAVLPGALYYSQEARMYTLLLCALLGALLSAIHYKWLPYMLCSLVAIYSQNLGLISVAALNIGVLLVYGWSGHRFGLKLIDTLRRPVLAMAVVVILWLPWLAVELRQAAAMGVGFWLEALNPSATIQPFFNLSMGGRVAPQVAFVAYSVALVFSIVGLVSGRRWLKTRQGVLVLALMIGPPVMLAVVSWLWRSIYLPRALIASVYLVSLLWGWLLCNLPKPDRRVAHVTLVPLLAICLISFYFPNQGGRADWRDNVTFIKTAWQPGDVMYYGSINAAIAVGYYMQGYDYALRHTVGDLNQSLTPETQAAFGFREAEFDQLVGLGYKRAWLVVGINPLSNIDEMSEIKRILTIYPNTDVKTYFKSSLSEQSIYLVDLQKGS